MLMAEQHSELLSSVASYYSQKLSVYGVTPAGVDWKGEASQALRFEQLAKILPHSLKQYSLNDLGCGYGALLDFLSPAKYPKIEYEGVDISDAMINAACARHVGKPFANFYVGNSPTDIRDFSIASGIFNVRLNMSNEKWLKYIKNTLDILDTYSKRGFAFNCLTIYSDIVHMRSDLYYADPLVLFDLCKNRYSKNVALLHDYDLYEFTILVRKL
jgi:SAM-dependent methyltransferase